MVEGAYTYAGSGDGEPKRLQVFNQAVRLGKASVVITTLRDMSQWMKLQHERQLHEFKTVAFASAAHEFRNPLNSILQSLELL